MEWNEKKARLFGSLEELNVISPEEFGSIQELFSGRARLQFTNIMAAEQGPTVTIPEVRPVNAAADITVNGVVRDLPSWLRKNSGFAFGRKSEAEMVGVKSQLIDVARLALIVSPQDFMFYDGLRTDAEQANMVARGVSKTQNSKHKKQADGFGHAMDLVPVVGTIPKWEWPLIFPVVAAVDWAATVLGVADKIRWGGAWDRTLADFGGDPKMYAKEIEAYAARHPGKDFLDGPHFEWKD